MERAVLGRTGLEVSRLGAGLVQIGRKDVGNAGRLLNEALDGGVTFLDTAECYGHSEEFIGRTIAHRRSEFVLATKVGHAVDRGSRPVGVDPEGNRSWSASTMRESIDRSLRRMKTDRVDLLQVHSYDTSWPLEDDVLQVLLDARQAGKVRFLGYSQEGNHAELAVRSGIFDTLQVSFSLIDQRPRLGLLALARNEDVGIIAKRPIANAAWGQSPAEDGGSGPRTNAQRTVAQRMAAQGPIPAAPEDPVALALGFVLAHPEVATAIVGTGDPDHMRHNISIVENQLPPSRRGGRRASPALRPTGLDLGGPGRGLVNPNPPLRRFPGA